MISEEGEYRAEAGQRSGLFACIGLGHRLEKSGRARFRTLVDQQTTWIDAAHGMLCPLSPVHVLFK